MSDLPAAMRRVRGPVAGQFLARHALSREDAIAFAPKNRIERWWFDLVGYHRGAEALSRRWVPIAIAVSPASLGVGRSSIRAEAMA